MIAQSLHIPCMVDEVLGLLQPEKGDIIVDATFGFGGHTRAILERFPDCKIIGIERDETIVQMVKEEFKDKRVEIFCDNYVNLPLILEELNVKEVDAVIFDLGLSLFHIEKSGRGFTFRKDETLDMRFSTQQGKPLWLLLKEWTQKDIENIIKTYGEEPFARKIARKIFRARGKISTSLCLGRIIDTCVSGARRQKAKQRVFQSFRIFINRELENLSEGLKKAYQSLTNRGRLLALTYHSLEDRLVKRFLKTFPFEVLTPKPITPSSREIERNPRARSCKLRAGVKKK